MLPFRRILFPVDFSPSSQAVAPFVRHMAEHHAAAVTLLHAYELLLPAVDEFGQAVTPVTNDAEVLAQEQARLNSFAGQWFPGMDARCQLEQGQAAEVVLDAIRSDGADLVMLPTHGRGALRRLLLGSVAAKVLHDASCAVWTAVDSGLSGREPAYRSILCALDPHADDAPAVLQGGVALARSFGAALTVMYVVETPPVSWEIDFEPYRRQLMDRADLELRRLIREAGADATALVVSGSVSEGIRETALGRGADLIVAGRGHVQGRLARLWSHLYAVVRDAPCPVLSL